MTRINTRGTPVALGVIAIFAARPDEWYFAKDFVARLEVSDRTTIYGTLDALRKRGWVLRSEFAPYRWTAGPELLRLVGGDK